MPTGAVRLKPGINVEQTLALNTTGWSSSAYVRFRDGLPEKLGGWTRYYPVSVGDEIRALHPWQDINAVKRLGVGTLTALQLIQEGSLRDITPLERFATVTVDVSTTIGSSLVEIVDTGCLMTTYDTVEIQTPLIVGGLSIYGVYQITAALSNDRYQIDVGVLATSTVVSGGVLPEFNTTSGSAIVTVDWVAHGFSVGSTVPFIHSTTSVGGVEIQGLYTVLSVPTADSFTISVSSQATSSTSGFMNNGNAAYYYFVTRGPQAAGSGYGSGGYGSGGYGTGTAVSGGNGTPITATDWTLDNWGSDLIACPQGGAIYVWSPLRNFATATLVPNCPIHNTGAFVAMPQRQIIAYGAEELGEADPLLVRWCDVSDYTVWTGTAINEAGQYRLPRGSKIVGGMQVSQQIILWTDLGVWSMQYIGLENGIYGFNEVGKDCGLIAQKAATSSGNIIAWMGQNGFYMMTSNGVETIDCPVWDVVFQNINRAYVDNIRAGSNADFSELWWFYPSVNSLDGENDSFVKVQVRSNAWDFGPIGRSAWADKSVLGQPLAASNGIIYQHESGRNDDTSAMNSVIRSGWFALEEGQNKITVDLIWPDFKFAAYDGSSSGAVYLTFYLADYPEGPVRVFGPIRVDNTTQYINKRMRGRLMSIQISSNDLGTFWRLGNIRYRYQIDGAR